MTVSLLEGFDGGSNDITTRQNVTLGSNGLRTSTGRTGALSFDTQGSGNTWWQYDLPAADQTDTINVCAAIRGPVGNPRYVFRISSDAATEAIVLKFDDVGRFHVYRDGYATTLLGSSNIGDMNLDDTTWTHVELEVVMHDTTGTVRLWVNGGLVIDLSNIDTLSGASTVFTAVRITGHFSNYKVDDLVIANHTGKLGDIGVHLLLPSGNGNSSDLVGSDADSTDNYLLVDDANPSTADYVGSAVVDDHDTYAFDDLPVTSGSVVAVEARITAFKSDAGDRAMRAVHRENAVDSFGDDQVLSTSQESYPAIWEQNPARSAAWSITQINQSEFGMAVRAV